MLGWRGHKSPGQIWSGLGPTKPLTYPAPPQQSTSLDALRQGTPGNSHSHTFCTPGTCCRRGSRAAPPYGLSRPFRSDPQLWLLAEVAELGWLPFEKKIIIISFQISGLRVYSLPSLPRPLSYSREIFERRKVKEEWL